MIVADTGIFISAADRSEPSHQTTSDILRSAAKPAPVVPEASWLIEDHLGPHAEVRFLQFVLSARVEIVDLTIADYERCVELILEYADLGLGLVDASIIVVAERLDLSTIATLNRRDFAVVRPAHCDAFELVP